MMLTIGFKAWHEAPLAIANQYKICIQFLNHKRTTFQALNWTLIITRLIFNKFVLLHLFVLFVFLFSSLKLFSIQLKYRTFLVFLPIFTIIFFLGRYFYFYFSPRPYMNELMGRKSTRTIQIEIKTNNITIITIVTFLVEKNLLTQNATGLRGNKRNLFSHK